MAKVNVQKLTTPQKVAIVRLHTQYHKNAAETACQFSYNLLIIEKEIAQIPADMIRHVTQSVVNCF